MGPLSLFALAIAAWTPVGSAFLLLVVRPGAPSSVLVPSSDALLTSSVLAPSSKARSP